MSPWSRSLLLVSVLVLSCFVTFGQNDTRLPPEEVDALRQIAKVLQKNDWNFEVNPCNRASGWTVAIDPSDKCDNYVNCSCQVNATCHVEAIVLKCLSLQGALPKEMALLLHLKIIDFSRNYLSGTIPAEWASLPLTNISLMGNRLSGEIPPALGNIITLLDLTLEANQFTGRLPSELGNLTKLVKVQLGSNGFTGELPQSFSNLTALLDFRINDNNFTGKIPDLIRKWTKLEKLAIQASGFEGPIPSGISLLKNLTDLRISDINGIQTFPDLSAMKSMKTLILRNCGISGEIPLYIGNMTKLKHLDLSFNYLSGNINDTFKSRAKPLDYMFLTRNNLTGPIPDWMMRGTNVDLSYNNFIWSQQPCQQGNLNLFGNFDKENYQSPAVLCMESKSCAKRHHSMYINCGGEETTINKTTYAADSAGDRDSSSKTFVGKGDWVLSSTGEFLDDDTRNQYIVAANTSLLSMPDQELYKVARLSAISLTYYARCLQNANYTVKLHFAEIVITDDRKYSSLGKRIFDVYIQNKLELKDFNIKNEANGSYKAIAKNFTAEVTDGTLEIRFYWAGKGTISIPRRGDYGPLISAISVDSGFRTGGISVIIVIVIVASVMFFVFLVLAFLWWKGYLGGKTRINKELQGLELQTGSFTLRQIKAATNNFNAENKIGEGGFGSVYKGLLSDGMIIAVKQLSTHSKQGNREFLNEIGMISALHHPNLVKLYGCCIEGDQLLLVYEFMENNSLARALFGPEECQLKFDWSTRHKICVGVARGLAYLHEESRLKIVHRDIKSTNVLLDRDLNPKISDFGLAKLFEDENTHISTRIAGTIGYMAPEYATRGYLTEKVDIYSFGIVALEIVSGKSITSYRNEDHVHLLDWAQALYEEGNLVELVDPRLESQFDKEEVTRMITVALLCTNSSPSLRPMMSKVVSMLNAESTVPDAISISDFTSDESKREFSDLYKLNPGQISRESQSLLLDEVSNYTSASASDLYPINPDSYSWSKRD